MTGLAGAEALVLILRLAFAVSLYVFLAVALLALRRALAGAAPPVRGVSRLVLVEAGDGGDDAGRAVPLVGRASTLGRGPANDIVVRDDGVSSHHLRLEASGDGWQVSDVGSRNGTTVNGRSVDAPVRLRHGDTIRTGGLAWRYEALAPRPAGQR